MLPSFDDLVREIKSKRRDLAVSQAELAGRAGVSQSLLAKLEQRENIPNYESVWKILKALRELEGSKDFETAKDVTHREIVSVKPDDPIKRAAGLMKDNDYSQLPVKKNDQYVGIVLSKDMVTASRNAPIREVMRYSLPIIPHDTPQSAVAELLKTNNAILIKEKNKIIGIITPADLL